MKCLLGTLSPTIIQVDSNALCKGSFTGDISASLEPLRNLAESCGAQQIIQSNRTKYWNSINMDTFYGEETNKQKNAFYTYNRNGE